MKNSPHMLAALAATLAAVTIISNTGCGTVHRTFYNSQAVVTTRPAVTVTNLVMPTVSQVFTNSYQTPAGDVVTEIETAPAGQVFQHITTAPAALVTNEVLTPKPLAMAAAKTVESLPFPFAAPIGIGLGWLLTGYASWRNKKLSAALVSGIEAGRLILQTTPEGQRLDARLKDCLIAHQEANGVLNAAARLVNAYTGDTVKANICAP